MAQHTAFASSIAALFALLVAASQASADRDRDAFASDNLVADTHGVYDADFSFRSPAARIENWFTDEDWADYGSYFTDDLRSGYGGAYGHYQWGTGRWSFSDRQAERPRARDIEWRSDRFGVFEHGYAWSSPNIGLDAWSATATRDWAGYDESGDPAWFGF